MLKKYSYTKSRGKTAAEIPSKVDLANIYGFPLDRLLVCMAIAPTQYTKLVVTKAFTKSPPLPLASEQEHLNNRF